MATYLQILKAKTQGRRRLWYICGSKQALVQDAYELAKAHVHSGVADLSTKIFFGGDVDPSDLRTALAEDFWEERHLVILLDAEKFAGWDEVLPELKALSTTSFFIAVSNESDPDTTLPHLRLFIGNQKSRFVICNSLTDEGIRLWITSRLNISMSAVHYLVERCKGDFEWLLNQLRKLEAMQTSEISLNLVEALCWGHGHAPICKSLLNFRKKDAILSVRWEQPEIQEVHTLTRAVRKASLLNAVVPELGHYSRPLTDRTGLSVADLTKYKDISGYYDSITTARCLTALNASYDGLSRGETASWYSLISRW